MCPHSSWNPHFSYGSFWNVHEMWGEKWLRGWTTHSQVQQYVAETQLYIASQYHSAAVPVPNWNKLLQEIKLKPDRKDTSRKRKPSEGRFETKRSPSMWNIHSVHEVGIYLLGAPGHPRKAFFHLSVIRRLYLFLSGANQLSTCLSPLCSVIMHHYPGDDRKKMIMKLQMVTPASQTDKSTSTEYITCHPSFLVCYHSASAPSLTYLPWILVC